MEENQNCIVKSQNEDINECQINIEEHRREVDEVTEDVIGKN